jgi:hypothetical protein
MNLMLRVEINIIILYSKIFLTIRTSRPKFERNLSSENNRRKINP